MTSNLEAFFDGRTIGYHDDGWTWRGSEYDNGWVTPTEEELRELQRLLNDHLA